MRRPDPDALFEIAQIRRLQRSAAEDQALRAAAELQDKSAALAAAELKHMAVEHCWQESLHSMKPEITFLWFVDCQRQESCVRMAEGDMAVAGDQFRRRTLEANAAMARCDMADAIARRAKRAQLERRDEFILQSALDRHAGKGREL